MWQVKEPSDLGTVCSRVQRQGFATLQQVSLCLFETLLSATFSNPPTFLQWVRDIDLIWANALLCVRLTPFHLSIYTVSSNYSNKCSLFFSLYLSSLPRYNPPDHPVHKDADQVLIRPQAGSSLCVSLVNPLNLWLSRCGCIGALTLSSE